MVSDVPIRPELGAGRPYYELAQELRRLGHEVATFDRIDAFGHDGRTMRDRFMPLRFASRARRYVRENGARFDVVDANQGNLPYTRPQLGLHGVLVARSAGLYAFYRDYRRLERQRWPERLPGTWLGQRLQRWHTDRTFASERRSFERCDLAIFPNREEEEYARREIRPGKPCATIPLALSDGQASALASAAAPASQRLEAREVAFIGFWSLRKGAADWGTIVRTARERVPAASFLFLGTGVSRETVLRDLGIGNDDGIRVVPAFAADALPALLSGATLGALPSYVEAGPFSVLETLAAGLPTVAYDAPGARALITEPTWLVPAGDAESFGRRVAELLSLAAEDYGVLAERAAAATKSYRWTASAQQTLAAYAEVRPA
jgi:glycosyltransferase involved in cell wall biosynthesis